MKLYEHQREILKQNPKIRGLFWECGLGKTLTSIKLVEQNASSCLIVCPKSLKINWHREIDKWSQKITIWHIVTKEEFRRDFATLAKSKYESIIIDEAHNFFGHKSKMHKSAMLYLKHTQPECVYLLTATPMMASPYSIMAMESLLARKASWKDYTYRFFDQARFGPRTVWQPKKTAQASAELQSIIHDCGSVRSAKECLDLPDKIYLREDFDLTPEQKRAIKELDDDIVSVAPIVRWTKVHQICGGTQKTSESDVLYASLSVSRVSEYLENERKIVVVCRYNAELKMLHDKLDDSLILNGQTKNRQEVLDEFESKTTGALLINASVSEGFNLRGVNTMIFYSLSFSLKDRIQMEGRIHGSNRGVEGEPSKYIDFVVPNTIDEDVFNCIQSKTDFQIELYERNNNNL